MKSWLGSWEKQQGALPRVQSKRLLSISAAHIDRLLAPYRSAGRKRRIASEALAAMQREVVVRSGDYCAKNAKPTAK